MQAQATQLDSLKPMHHRVILDAIIAHTAWIFKHPLPGLKPPTEFLIFLKPFMDKICNTT